MDLELELVGVDNLLAAVLALHMSGDMYLTRRVTYDGGGLGGLDGETVGLNGGASTGSVGPLVLLVSLRNVR